MPHHDIDLLPVLELVNHSLVSDLATVSGFLEVNPVIMNRVSYQTKQIEHINIVLRPR